MRGAFGGYFGPSMKRKAKQWAAETPDISSLPNRKKKSKAPNPQEILGQKRGK